MLSINYKKLKIKILFDEINCLLNVMHKTQLTTRQTFSNEFFLITKQVGTNPPFIYAWFKLNKLVG